MTQTTDETKPGKNAERKRSSGRGAMNNAEAEAAPAPAAERAKFAILSNKLYLVLDALKDIPTKNADTPAHTVIRFTASEAQIEFVALDDKCFAQLFITPEYCTKPASFCLHVAHLPEILKMLVRLDAEDREKTDATITVLNHDVEFKVGSSRHRVPFVEEQLPFPEFNKLIPPRREPGIFRATAFGISPSLSDKVMKAAKRVSTCLMFWPPETVDSPSLLDIFEGKAGITGLFVQSSMSLNSKPAPGEEDDDNEAFDFDDDEDEGDED